MRSILQIAWVAAISAAVCWAAGCQGVADIAGPDAIVPRGENSAAYLDRISSQANVSENDALRGILLLLDGDDKAETFAQRVEILQGRSIVAQRWNHDASRPITRARLAYMIYQSCDMPGGVILTLTGPTQRYCLRELQWREMMRSGLGATPIAGMEFVSVLTRADTYIHTGKVPNKLGDTE